MVYSYREIFWYIETKWKIFSIPSNYGSNAREESIVYVEFLKNGPSSCNGWYLHMCVCVAKSCASLFHTPILEITGCVTRYDTELIKNISM